VYVAFTYRIPEGSLQRPDLTWHGAGAHYVRTDEQRDVRSGRIQHAALPIEQSRTMIKVVVPPAARTGPIALFGYGACVPSRDVLVVRVAPAPR
jgi:hypothetical protein